MKQTVVTQLPEEQRQIVKHIFKGSTIAQIAKEINCSESTISYQINLLYSKYNSKNRSEFMLNVFAKIIENYKKLLVNKVDELLNAKKELDETKNIISSIAQNRDNPVVLDYWIDEAKNFF